MWDVSRLWGIGRTVPTRWTAAPMGSVVAVATEIPCVPSARSRRRSVRSAAAERAHSVPHSAATASCPVDGKLLPPPDPAVAELGQFVLIERLGDGGMGTVYKAVHKRLGRVVAIKLLHRDLTTDRALVGRFFYEARAANTIRH